ncbi:MAG TPA: hypothetical protein VFV94_14475 [Polyangiaceae bacterium]|nr:hypothetical protein [Polyangiaceae bacterium]
MGQIDGPKASKMRVSLMMRIKDAGYLVTDAEDLKTGSSKATIKKMAKALQVDAVLLGKISGGNDLTLSVYKPDGRLVEQVKVKGGSSVKLENAIQDEFDDVIAAPVARASGGKGVVAAASDEEKPVEEAAEPEVAESQATQPPPEEQKPSAAELPPEEEKPAEAAAKDDDQGDKKPAKPGRSPLELDLRLRVYSRAWKYTDLRGVRDPAQPHRTLEPYNLDFAPAIELAGILYPAAFFTDGIASNFGLMGSFMQGFATSTDFEQAIPGTTNKLVTELKTTSQAWDLGLRGRIPIGPAEIALFVTYGQQSFILHGDEGGTNSLAPLVPDVRYNFVRIGGEGRVRFAKVLLGAHVAPRILTSLHQIDLANVWFPGATGSGLDFGLMAGYGVLPFMDVMLSADFVGYGFDFNAIPANPQVAPVVAGGATDRYNSLSLGVKFTLGGT